MFTCCLCKKEYKTEQEAVKCINRCGRSLPPSVHPDNEIPCYEVVHIESEIDPNDIISQLSKKGVYQ